MKEPQISIIVPIYNTEAYLHRCVDSILAQSFSDFELLLVDDGSTDNSPAICDAYAQKDSRVRVAHKNQGGVSSARNTGLQMARAEYVMFCDSDDHVDPRWCRLMYEAIRAYPDSLVTCNRADEEEGGFVPKGPCLNGETEALEKGYFFIYSAGISGGVDTCIFLRSRIREIGLCFDQSRTLGEDGIFFNTYAQHCKGMRYIPTPLYYYHCTPGSLVHRYYANDFELALPIVALRLTLISEEDMQEFCNINLGIFLRRMENTMDPRNPASLIQKLRYNQRMMKSPEYQFCVQNAAGTGDPLWVMKLLRKPNYYLFWLTQELSRAKRRLLGQGR